MYALSVCSVYSIGGTHFAKLVTSKRDGDDPHQRYSRSPCVNGSVQIVNGSDHNADGWDHNVNGSVQIVNGSDHNVNSMKSVEIIQINGINTA